MSVDVKECNNHQASLKFRHESISSVGEAPPFTINTFSPAFCVFQPHTPPLVSPQAASLPMSIIIVGVGPAEFDGMCCGYI